MCISTGQLPDFQAPIHIRQNVGKGAFGYVTREDSRFTCLSSQYDQSHAPNEDSDQPAHPRSLIIVFARRSVDSQEANASSSRSKDADQMRMTEADIGFCLAHMSECTISNTEATICFVFQA